MDLEDQIVKPLAHNCLAHPSDLALDKSNELLYVCETMQNRLLRFYVGEDGSYLYSVFH